MQASFAGRTTDCDGRPAPARSAIGTSQDHEGLAALVIIATQISPNSWRPGVDTTSAGRRFSASRSAYGQGTITTSNGANDSEAAIRIIVVRAAPLGELGERFVTGEAFWRLVDDDTTIGDPIAQDIAGPDAERIADAFGEDGLTLHGDSGVVCFGCGPHFVRCLTILPSATW